jgi:transcriptional regulator with XRE-family HTH domain
MIRIKKPSKKQTAILREARKIEKRQAKDLNNIGKRLCWIRKSLGLTMSQVAVATEIPPASYREHENDVRTIYYEEYIVMANFFNGLWKKILIYEGVVVDKITPMFLMFGRFEDDKDFTPHANL